MNYSRFTKGDIVVLPFPFSDLSASKKRPALVTAGLIGDDIILCEITSKPRMDAYIISLDKEDMEQGSLGMNSIIRTNRLFTADKSIICYKLGKLKSQKVKEVEERIVNIFKE